MYHFYHIIIGKNIACMPLHKGWPVGATIGWGTAVVPFVVFGALIINLVMLLFKLTKTLNIDIFNYWQFLIVGGIIYAGTDNLVVGVISALVLFVITLLVADKSSKKINEVYGLSGVSFSHALCTVNIPVGVMVNWVIERIPGIRKIDINSEKISKRFGVLGEPLTLGVILGALLGILAGLDFTTVTGVAVKMAAVMVLLPAMVEVLITGLTTIREALEITLKKRFPNREIYIGMDPSIMMNNEVVATGVLLIPISLLLAVILPGNKVLPFVDLASFLFLVLMLYPFCKKNMFRMLISGIVIVIGALYIGGDIADAYTEAAHMAGVTMPEGVSENSLMTNLAGGATTVIGWIVEKVAMLF